MQYVAEPAAIHHPWVRSLAKKHGKLIMIRGTLISFVFLWQPQLALQRRLINNIKLFSGNQRPLNVSDSEKLLASSRSPTWQGKPRTVKQLVYVVQNYSSPLQYIFQLAYCIKTPYLAWFSLVSVGFTASHILLLDITQISRVLRCLISICSSQVYYHFYFHFKMWTSLENSSCT